MIHIILPVYNEEEGIVTLLKRIDLTLREHDIDYRIILVDDGSTDGSMRAVAPLKGVIPMDVLSHGKNRGLGEAIKTGIMQALRVAEDSDVVVTMDADNTHVPGLIMRLSRNIWEGCDVVIASRHVRGARVIGVPLYRKLLAFGASILFRVFFHIKGVKDFTCGYRAYRAGLLKEAFKLYRNDLVSESGFTCQIDILLKLRKLHLIMSEVPIILRYDRRKEASKMNVKKTILDTFRLFFRRLLKK